MEYIVESNKYGAEVLLYLEVHDVVWSMCVY